MARLLERIDSPRDLKRLAPEDLPALCQEIRDEIVATCAKNGGHLGSSLGAVELVVALHYVYASPLDRLVFDVGHQAYAHKLLTGRRDRFRTIRTEGDLAGFPERHESEHDAFGVGHASTAVSAALGMVEGRRLNGEQGRIVALVGDGALTGGIAFEGLNQAGYLGRDMLVVLNDNEMSISPNVGALSEWFTKKFASRTFNHWRRTVKEILRQMPKGRDAIAVIRHAINATKALVSPGILFEGLGFQYVGPVDGHDVVGLVETFKKVAACDGAVLVHAITTKGKGYQPAETDLATRGHGLSFFDVATGKSVAKKPAVKSYTDLFAEALCDEMERDKRVVAITAAMLEGTGLIKCKQRFPDRTYDVALQKLPVTFALDRGGLVGADGKTHQGAFDLAYLRCVPNMVVMAPSDENELRHMLATALAHDGPAAFRFPRGSGQGVSLDAVPRRLEIGKARVVRDAGPRLDGAV